MQKEAEREVDEHDHPVYDEAGFPSVDEEYEDVTDINEQMVKARDDWSPEPAPSYNPTEGAELSGKTGVVRAIERKERLDKEYDIVQFGIDTGGEELEWVKVKDTGERSLSNDYVRLCKMYGVNPENVQELYNTEIAANYRGWVFTESPYPVFKQLSKLYIANHTMGLFKVKRKASGFRGLVPTRRFLAAYGLATAGSWLLLDVTQGSVAGILAGIMTFFVSLLFLWGVYAKARYDMASYAAEWMSWAMDKYKHENA